MIALNQVDLGENRFAQKLTSKVSDVGHRITVSLDVAIEASKIPTWAPTTTRLGCNVEWGCPLTGGAPDNPKVLHLFECSLGDSEFVGGQMLSWWVDRRRLTSVNTKLNPMRDPVLAKS